MLLENAKKYKQSLYFIKAERFNLLGVENKFNNKLDKKGAFDYEGTHYRLSLTDPIENKIKSKIAIKQPADTTVYLCISLGEPFNEKSYKLIAGVRYVKEITNKTVFTIGHSTHTLEVFLNLLEDYNIDTIVDVRSTPSSKFNPHFNSEPLNRFLNKHRKKYVFLGHQLGARSKDPEHYDKNGRVVYDFLEKGTNFKKGIDNIISEREKGAKIALMCAEKDPSMCHRSILVCKNIIKSGIDVRHILSNGTLEQQQEMEQRLMTNLKILPDLLRSEDECIKEVYRVQGEKIAFKK